MPSTASFTALTDKGYAGFTAIPFTNTSTSDMEDTAV
jgi:hypothetical protein